MQRLGFMAALLLALVFCVHLPQASGSAESGCASKLCSYFYWQWAWRFKDNAECEKVRGFKYPVTACFANENDCMKCHDPNTYCSLKQDKGTCLNSLEKYFYNAKTGQCEIFTYGGCGGNKNHFNSKIECEKTCNGTGQEANP